LLIFDTKERLRVWLCLHLPEEEIPEAFAAHKGQFEVHMQKAKLPAATREPKELFLTWLKEQMDAHLEARIANRCTCGDLVSF